MAKITITRDHLSILDNLQEDTLKLLDGVRIGKYESTRGMRQVVMSMMQQIAFIMSIIPPSQRDHRLIMPDDPEMFRVIKETMRNIK